MSKMVEYINENRSVGSNHKTGKVPLAYTVDGEVTFNDLPESGSTDMPFKTKTERDIALAHVDLNTCILNQISEDEDAEDHYDTIEGTVKFIKQPNPDEKTFQFKIATEIGEVDATIDRYSFNCENLLRDKGRYSFDYTGRGNLEIHSFEKRLSSVSDDEVVGTGDDIAAGDAFDNLMKTIDEKIFILECREKVEEKEYALIEVNLAGKPLSLRRLGKSFEFTIIQNEVKYSCVYDLEQTHSSDVCVFNQDTEYYIDGILIADKVYIRDAYASENPVRNKEIGSAREFAKAISSMSDRQKDEIERIVSNCEKHNLVEIENVPAFCSHSDLMKKYNLIKEYYPEEVQRIIETVNSSPIRKNHHAKILDYMINTMWGKKLDICAEYGYLKEKLDEKFYGQDHLKDEAIKTIMSYKYKRERKGSSILLVGKPGVGKTAIFSYLASLVGLPFEKIPLNGVDSPYYITGSPRLYDNATVGRIVEAIHGKGDRCVIMLDEVDKMTQGKEGEPMTGLFSLLDSELFVDNLIEQGIDLSNVIFVLTANDTSNIPTPILDRVNVVLVPGYTDEEKIVIARDYIIKDEMSKYDLGEKQIIWKEEAIDTIANRYSLTNGVRDIERNVATVTKNALLLLEKDKKHEITVSRKNVCELLEIIPCCRDELVFDIAGLKNKFRYFKSSYSVCVREEIMNLFVKYDAIKDEWEREVIRKKLSYIVNIIPDGTEKKFDLVKIKKELDASHYGMEEVKNAILSYFATRNVNSKAGAKCLWLDGPFGVGKTTIAEAIAKATNREFAKISLNGVTTSSFIKGHEVTFKDALPGKVMEEYSKAGTDRFVILLDEIDKMSSSANGDPYAALLDLLDDSAMFTDNFVGIPIDVSNILFIATSNEAAKVPVSIADRMELISLNGYTWEEKIYIAEKYVAKKKFDKYKVEKSVLPVEIIKEIVEDYCKSYGVRDVDKAIDKVLREYVKETQLGNMIEEINSTFVRKVLGSRPLKRGNIAEISTPGIARALAVSGNAGTTFAVQVTENPYGKADEVTGLPKQSTLDSIKISKLLVSKMLERKLPNLHIHFGEGGIEKNGPSAGITIFSALCSCLTGIEIDNKIGMTGEICIHGRVWPVGGLELKITAAENEGCTRVLVPMANYQQLVEEDKLGKYRCEIIPVSNVTEVYETLFGECKIKR